MATGWTIIGSTRWQLDGYTGTLHEPEQAPTTDSQRRIVEATQATPSPGKNLCAMWVSQVFSRAGLGYPKGNARDMFWQWCDRSDLRDLKVGMIVAVPSHTHTYMGGIYGHVCIYIGGAWLWITPAMFARCRSMNGSLITPRHIAPDGDGVIICRSHNQTRYASISTCLSNTLKLDK